MKYVLMQAPKKEGEPNSQIAIIDNSNQIGKQKIEKLTQAGYTCVGYIESELHQVELKRGFTYEWDKRIQNLQNLILQIGALAEKWIDC